jgi:hypothetical protein
MHIKEIITNQSRDEDISKFVRYFATAAKTKATWNSQLLYAHVPQTEWDPECFGLFEGEDLVAVLLADTDRGNGLQITQTAVTVKWRRQGCLRYLINAATKMHGVIVTDDHQTHEAKEMWRGLVKFPGILRIAIRNEDGSEVKATTENFETAYDGESALLVARHCGTTLDEESDPRNVHHRRRRTGRDYHSIWFFFPDIDNP